MPTLSRVGKWKKKVQRNINFLFISTTWQKLKYIRPPSGNNILTFSIYNTCLQYVLNIIERCKSPGPNQHFHTTYNWPWSGTSDFGGVCRPSIDSTLSDDRKSVGGDFHMYPKFLNYVPSAGPFNSS